METFMFFHINIFGIKIVFFVLFPFLTFAFLLNLGASATAFPEMAINSENA
jgi:hypothetical protein